MRRIGVSYRLQDMPRAAPAAIAKHRLQQVIAADRAAVPAYRWVRQPFGLDPSTAVCIVAGAVSMSREQLARLLTLLKPRYRLERRQ